jgi:hypothetical protein
MPEVISRPPEYRRRAGQCVTGRNNMEFVGVRTQMRDRDSHGIRGRSSEVQATDR